MIDNSARKKSRVKTLRMKIIGWTFIPSLLILLLVAVVNLFSYRQVTEELVIQRNRELARLKAWQVSSELTEFTLLLEYIASSMYSPHLPDFMKAPDYPPNQVFSIFDGGLVILDYLGRVAETWPEDTIEAGANWSESSVFRRIIAHNVPHNAVSDLEILIRNEEEIYIRIGVPIQSLEGRFAGALVGVFKLQPNQPTSFIDAISRLRMDSRGTAYLVDGNGRIIYHIQADRVGEDISGEDIVRQVLAGKVGSLRMVDEQGADVVASYAPILGTRWGLITYERWSDLTASSQGYLLFLLGLLALGVLLPSTLVTFGIRKITQPIQDLTEAAKAVAGGQFGRTIQANTGDEIEELTHQFNRMSEELKESYANLEQRVTDRTRELETLNAIAFVVSRSLKLEEILSSALEKACEAVGVEAGAVLLQVDKGWLTLYVDKGLSDEFLEQVTRIKFGSGASGEAARTGLPVMKSTNDYKEADLSLALQKEGIELVVSVPLFSKERLMGAMNLCFRKGRDFSPEEISMLASIGRTVGVAVDNAWLYNEAEQTAVLTERNRLARELHDAVTQTLFSASLIAEVLPKIWERNPEEGRKRSEELRQLNRGALAEMRSLLLELRPSAFLDAELGELFRHLADAFTGRTQIPVSVNIDKRIELNSEVKVALYRIAQESLNNISKHARAKNVSMTLQRDGDIVRLEIKDDGIGFDQANIPTDHLGVGIMKERAKAIGAAIKIDSEPGSGTSISILIKADKELLEKAYG
jgi:nitrate/nitrite-specific signal transduction histidine kinase